MKKYGIYMLYSPGVNLNHQGLGRLLIYFLKASEEKLDTTFVIACPSWLKQSLIDLLENEDVNWNKIDIICPKEPPLLLSTFSLLKNNLIPYVSSLLKRFKRSSKKNDNEHNKIVLILFHKLVRSRSKTAFIILLILLSLVKTLSLISRSVVKIMDIVSSRLFKFRHRRKGLSYIHNILSNYKNIITIEKAYSFLRQDEARHIHELILSRKDITAWLCPAAFWPEFNEIPGPKLLCVPDVVLTEFPVGFSGEGGNRFLNIFKDVEKTINGAQHYVTYSESTKYNTLVKRYQANPKNVYVIPHGVNKLDELITITASQDIDSATKDFCKLLLSRSLYKAINNPYLALFRNADVKFIFYASQFRPNKNILSLLRAYNYLLKRKYIGHKLILTGDPRYYDASIKQFIAQNSLINDVIFLHGLTAQELAACYKLADLVVNPSLSEGGFPFTFTEALSVDTPVVMARIPVTEEVVKDPDLQQHMLFDGYDWKDMAERIEWALENKTFLLQQQKLLYGKLNERTWGDVVNDYIAVLEDISQRNDMDLTEQDNITHNQLLAS